MFVLNESSICIFDVVYYIYLEKIYSIYMHFTQAILSWYYKNKEDFPWRLTNDPYKIWISEIMLQQTQ